MPVPTAIAAKTNVPICHDLLFIEELPVIDLRTIARLINILRADRHEIALLHVMAFTILGYEKRSSMLDPPPSRR